ncbi:MAG: class I SAM-dependent methyltransferase, partial [bacterium]|nr:class I SAM-dependent methyltransferase [bacterium]
MKISKMVKNKEYKTVKKCRICGNSKLKSVLDLGKMPPANAFAKPESKKVAGNYPLVLKFCEKCSLAQLGHVVSPKILFSDYHYLTSASRPLAEHFIEEAKMIAEKYKVSQEDLVVEFGSNDGVLLGALKNRCRVLGVDPAENVAQIAKQNGVETFVAYFGKRSAEEIKEKHGQARIIIAYNVFAHIDDISDVIKGVSTLLSPNGVFISESHWVGNLIGDGGFDQIHHEHLSYYSLHSLKYLAEQHGFIISDIKLVPIHGASLRVFVSKTGKPTAAVDNLLKKERKLGLNNHRAFSIFAIKVRTNKREAVALIKKIRTEGKKIAGYGAPAKG